MGRKTSDSIVGSGIQALRHTQNLRRLTGENSVVVNYEDINSALGLYKTDRVDVGTEVTNLASGVLSGRRSMIVYNMGPELIFVGGYGVDASNGFPINPGQQLKLDVLGFGSIYGITKNQVSDVRVIQIA